MNKHSLFLLSCLLLVPGLGLSAEKKIEPDKMAGKKGIALKLANTSIGDSGLDEVDASFDAANMLTVSLSYFPKDDLSVELTAGSMETNIRVVAGSESAYFGKLKQTPIQLTAKVYNSTFFERFTLYGGGGVGWYFNEISDSNLAGGKVNDFFALNRTVTKTKDSFGIHGIAGIEYELSDRVGLDADFTLSFTDTDIEVKRPDGSTRKSKMALNTLQLGIGLKYYF